MDRITKSYVNDFKGNYFENDTKLDENSLFEHFCNNLIVSNSSNKSFEIDDIWTGYGNEEGLDGIAILVNENIVTTKEQIDELIDIHGYLKAKYIFIQTTSSQTMNTSKLASFYDAILDFFNDSTSNNLNESILQYRQLHDHICSNFVKFKGNNPTIESYYNYLSSCVDANNHVNKKSGKFKNDISKLNIFGDIKTIIYSQKEIFNLVQKQNDCPECTFQFSNKVTLDGINGIDSSYYGLLPFEEFKKIIIDDDNEQSLKKIFENNVRDFLGSKDNTVNQSIIDTIKSENQSHFSILNNGITVVTKTISVSGNQFHLKDYQIVNGCQTTNILYENKDQIQDLVQIPIKIIATENEDLIKNITTSTNSQTEVKREQLSAIQDFPKKLEIYYNTMDYDGLRFERRSGQYRSEVKHRKKITIQVQIKSFLAIFHLNPSAKHYLSSYTKEIGNNNIFDSRHDPKAYYMSGLCYYVLDTFLHSTRENTIDKKYKKCRFFMLMLFPLIVNNMNHTKVKDIKLNKEKSVSDFCDPVIEKLKSSSESLNIFNIAIDVIEKSNIDYNKDYQPSRSKETIAKVLNNYNQTIAAGV